MTTTGEIWVPLDTIIGPVTTTYDIAGPGRRHPGSGMAEEGMETGLSHEIGTALGTAIGVMAAQRIGLAIPHDVAVGLVTGDQHRHLDPGTRAHVFEQIHHSHDIGFACGDPVGIGALHQGLGQP